MGVIRNIMYNVRGSGHYTLMSHEILARRRFNPNDLNVSCEGKSYMITGANGAMGSVVAKEIAKRGGEIHMVCRNEETAKAVQNEIIKSTGNSNIHLHILDLSESRKVYNFASNFRESHKKLDALVNNAGARFPELLFNSDGVEKTFAVNTLAPHILSRVLSPLLLQCMRGRILMMSSSAMLLTKLNARDPQLIQEKEYDMRKVFMHTKRQMVVLAAHYAEQYPDLFSASLHPGWVATPFTADVKVGEKMKQMWRTPEQGADTLLWLTISDAIFKLSNGGFFENRDQTSPHLSILFGTRVGRSAEVEFMNYMDEILVRVSS